MGYKLTDFGEMIANEVRIKPYIEALRRSIKPGCVVLEIGTGTGLMAMLACHFGARKVYAIEFDNVIEVARETSALNGLSEKIEFIQDLSTRITLPEQADVIVSDLRGVLPLYTTHIPSIMDARRFLAPNGVMIPSQDKIWAAVVSDPKLYESIIGPWRTDAFGFDTGNIRERATNTLAKCSFSAGQLVTEPQCWAVLDYSKISNPNVSGTLTWTIAADREAHGFGAWFETTLRRWRRLFLCTRPARSYLRECVPPLVGTSTTDCRRKGVYLLASYSRWRRICLGVGDDSDGWQPRESTLSAVHFPGRCVGEQ